MSQYSLRKTNRICTFFQEPDNQTTTYDAKYAADKLLYSCQHQESLERSCPKRSKSTFI